MNTPSPIIYHGSDPSRISGVTFPAPQPAGAPPTLVATVARVQELNKRLYDLRSKANGLAHAIGGPFPVADQLSPVGDESIIGQLNAEAVLAHDLVTAISDTLDAIQSAIGSN